MYCRKDIYSYMALEVGSIVEGTVTGLAKFGVFVEIADKKSASSIFRKLPGNM